MSSQVSERSRIMAAAYKCLAATNGSGVSVTDILNAAGLSTRAFYRHFESKDNLLLAMFRRDSDRLYAEMNAAANARQSPCDALSTWIESYLNVATQPRRRQRVLLFSSPEIMRASGYAEERARSMAQLQAGLAQILRRGRDDDSFPGAKPEADARAIRAALTEAFAEQISGAASVSAAEAANDLTDFAFRALGALKSSRRS